MHYSKSISDDPRYFTSQRSTLSDLLWTLPLSAKGVAHETRADVGEKRGICRQNLPQRGGYLVGIVPIQAPISPVTHCAQQ